MFKKNNMDLYSMDLLIWKIQGGVEEINMFVFATNDPENLVTALTEVQERL